MLVLDPLVEFHCAEENDNTRLKAVIAQLRALARQFNLSVVLSHHTRKGAVVPGELEPMRGASAIGGAVRFAFTLCEMTREEADRFATINHASRRYYLRLDRARGSYAAPAEEDEWFEKVGFTLDNGDETPALQPWQPPEAHAPNRATLARLISAIGDGCPEAGGQPWSPRLRGDMARSVRKLFQRHGVNALSEHVTLQALTELGVAEASYHTSHRDDRLGLRTADGLPAARWNDLPQ